MHVYLTQAFPFFSPLLLFCCLDAFMHVSVFDMIAEKTVQVTNEKQHVLWEEYGLRLHIPHNALPEDCTHSELKMAVALSGHFSFPRKGIPVSGIYSFSHDLGDKQLRRPVTLEIQHCVNVNAVDGLCIVRADENSEAPYEFKDLPEGVFTQKKAYGTIQLHHFCRITTFLWWRLLSSIYTLEYCAKLYYTNIEPGGFDFHLYVIPNLNIILKVCEGMYTLMFHLYKFVKMFSGY